jgi:DHA2 family multidrug resistance protein-like MFS transporter
VYKRQDQLSAAVLDTARQAFTQGLRVTAAISAAVAIGLAVIAASLLRRVGPSSGPAAARPEPHEPA